MKSSSGAEGIYYNLLTKKEAGAVELGGEGGHLPTQFLEKEY